MQSILAIIPARSGSKGVPGKNIAKFRDHPLLAYSIAAAKMCTSVARVLLSTDSAEYAEIGRRYGAEVPFLRPLDISLDLSTDREFLLHTLDWLNKHEGFCPNLIVHLRPTTPIRDPQKLEEAIAIMQRSHEADSLRSAHLSSACPFKWFALDPQSDWYETISPHVTLEQTNLPRQAFPPVYIPNGYVDILKPDVIRAQSSIHGSKIHKFLTDVCHDIDDPRDLARLEVDPSTKSSPLFSYLNDTISWGKNGRHF